jgi:hypothetical protein
VDVLGLAHSNVDDAVMAENIHDGTVVRALPSDDDVRAICATYPPRDGPAERDSINTARAVVVAVGLVGAALVIGTCRMRARRTRRKRSHELAPSADGCVAFTGRHEA